MREAVIVEAVRTPVGRVRGRLAGVRSDEILADVLKELVERAGVNNGVIEDVIVGCVSQTGEQGGNIARTSALMAGYPIKVPGVTIDRQCGSSLQAVHFAAQAIISGDMDVVVAAGVESMSRVPMFSNMDGAHKSPIINNQYELINQGLSAERIAEKWGLTEQELNEYSVESHRRALESLKNGTFDQELVKLENIQIDEGPRPGTTVEVLAGLKKVFKEDGLISAGNASQMSDGASAVLIMSHDKAKELGLKPMAKIISRAVVGSDPTLMLTGPIEATKQALERVNLSIEDIDTYEVNEAFAPVPLAWLKELGADPSKLNPNGGAIALGHPLGATGTKLLTTIIHRMEREQLRYGLIAICEGMGMANATIIERLE